MVVSRPTLVGVFQGLSSVTPATGYTGLDPTSVGVFRTQSVATRGQRQSLPHPSGGLSGSFSPPLLPDDRNHAGLDPTLVGVFRSIRDPHFGGGVSEDWQRYGPTSVGVVLSPWLAPRWWGWLSLCARPTLVGVRPNSGCTPSWWGFILTMATPHCCGSVSICSSPPTLVGVKPNCKQIAVDWIC